MTYPEFHYRWSWRLRSSPEALWPLVADTNRFNRDTSVPHVTLRGNGTTSLTNARRRVGLRRFGIAIDWEEEPFEWTRPFRFGVSRRYLTGPIATMRVLVELTPAAGDGTDLLYQVWARPKTAAGLAAIPAQISLIGRRRFHRTILAYDRIAAAPVPRSIQTSVQAVRFAPGGRERVAAIRQELVARGASPDLVARLLAAIEEGDELMLDHLRPYALADQWGVSRRAVLELCLLATRAGLIEFQWRVLCPLCRGARTGETTLRDLRSTVHCDSCNIDFTANFEQSVELAFRPNPAIREIPRNEFCVGGPLLTPHIVAQQLLPAGADRALSIPLEPGRYRLRTLLLPGSLALRAGPGGDDRVSLTASETPWPDREVATSTRPLITLTNTTTVEQLFVLERTAWTDDAATAADVITLQLFHDLFAGEALRPGEEFAVGSLAIVFTDLRNSTNLYREIGDAVAFGWVQDHFDVVKASIAAEGGTVVKTIGDAVMAVFRRPVSALRAMLDAQARLAMPATARRPLPLKVGVHYGPCIAVTLNDRLDYFGSTINIAARLEGQSTGTDVVVSTAVREDPEVVALLGSASPPITVAPLETRLKGFDDERFALWRLMRGS
jgi:class 3 adenylate cyclase